MIPHRTARSGSAHLLTHATLVNEGKRFAGHLLIENGRIAKIFRQQAPPSVGDHVLVRDMAGLHLLPGVIDDQVHFREPGLTHKADLETESRAAVAGGITSFMEMPNTLPQTITQQALQAKFDLASGKSLANYSFYMGATNENLQELRATDPAHVCGIKVFMGASTGRMLVDSPISLENIFRIRHIPIAVHCEDEDIIRRNTEAALQRYGPNIPMARHPYIRSHAACEKSSRLAISLAEKYQTRLHLLHLSTAGETHLLENREPLGQKRITAEACMHHLWFSDQDYERLGAKIKWNPAIKTERDRQALIQALQEGVIDVVATDHAPHTLKEKQRPYQDCPSGGPMVQHALPAMLEFVHKGIFTLEQVVALMAHHPALCFQIANKGFLREGYDADLVAVNLDLGFVVEKAQLHYKCAWSPLEDESFGSTVMFTFVNGNLVYENGRFHEEAKGLPLRFSR